MPNSRHKGLISNPSLRWLRTRPLSGGNASPPPSLPDARASAGKGTSDACHAAEVTAPLSENGPF